MSLNVQTCGGSDHCDQVIVTYCSSCCSVFCQTCGDVHKTCHDYNTLIPVTIDVTNKNLTALCIEHNVPAHFMCCENQFICLHCKEEDHKNHHHNTVGFLAGEIKACLENQKTLIGDVGDLLENSSKDLNALLSEISCIRESLRISLRKRMVKLLFDSVLNLSQEESRLLEQFDMVSRTHIQRYYDSNPNYFFDSVSKKTDVEIIIEKGKLYENVMQFVNRRFTVPSVTVAITDIGDYSMKPIGHLHVEYGDQISIGQPEYNSSFVGDFPQTDDFIEVTIDLMKKLEELLETVTIVNQNPSPAIYDQIAEEVAVETINISIESPTDRDKCLEKVAGNSFLCKSEVSNSNINDRFIPVAKMLYVDLSCKTNGHFSYFLLNTLDETLTLIKEHETKNEVKFSAVCASTNFGNTGTLERNHKIYWMDTGMPYMILGRKELDCEFGVDRHLPRKIKRRREKEARIESGYAYPRSMYTLSKETKKLGCRAKIQMKELVEFPDFKLEPEGKNWRRKRTSGKIKKELNKDVSTVKQIRKFLVIIPDVTQHEGHSTAEIPTP